MNTKIKSESKKRPGRTTIIVELPAELAERAKAEAVAMDRHFRAEVECALRYWIEQSDDRRQRQRLAYAKSNNSSTARKHNAVADSDGD